MDNFEEHLVEATDPANPTILGATVFVVNGDGEVLYKRSAGRQSLDRTSPAVDSRNTMALGSAGKILTFIATLQLVDRGLVGLNESVYGVLPELEKFEIISTSTASSTDRFEFHPQDQPITTFHMITHSSGIHGSGHPLVEEWCELNPQEFPEGTHGIIKHFSTPLIFQPGEGWENGHGVHWLQIFIERLSGQKFTDYIQNNIFDPLDMNLSTYFAKNSEQVNSKLLQGVCRDKDGNLVPAPDDGSLGGLTCSTSDIQKLFFDLLAPTSKLLKKESVDLLFRPAFAPDSNALKALRKDTADYAAPIGITRDVVEPPVNYSPGGLIIEGELPGIPFPVGTLTWNGYPNIIWALHQEKRLGMFFGTQMTPEDDPKTVSLTMEFFRAAWSKFG